MIGLNNKKIGFIIDSSSNIKDGQYDDVKVVPLGVSVQVGNDVKSYKDGIDFHENDLIVSLENKDASIKTSQASIQDMMKVVTEVCQQYDQVYVFPIHKNLSSNINSWQILKDDFPQLNVVMTCDIGFSFAWTIQQVKEFLKTNEGNETIIQRYINESILPHRCGFLMVEDLAQLIKGGRVKGIKAVIAKLLKIKPVILFNQDGLTNFDNAKNHEDLFKILDKYISDNYPDQKIARSILFVPSGNEEVKTQYVAEYAQHYGQIPYDVVNFPTVVVSHTGIKHVAIYVELK